MYLLGPALELLRQEGTVGLPRLRARGQTQEGIPLDAAGSNVRCHEVLAWSDVDLVATAQYM